MRDELYWERECDEARSLRSEGSLSHCEDEFDDVIANHNHDNVTSYNVARADTNCVNVNDASRPVYTEHVFSNDFTVLHDIKR